MFSRDSWNEIIESMRSNVFRTMLTAFGVFWGIFILVLLLAAGNGLENGITSNFSGLATNSMFVWTSPTSKPYEGLPISRSFNFKNNDIVAIKNNFPELKYVSPRNQLGGFSGSNNVVRGLKTGAFSICGDYPEYFFQEPMDITEGRFINYNDIDNRSKVVTIGQGVVNELYDKDEEVLGSYIKINGVNFQVIGIFKKKGMDGQNGEEAQKTLYVPFSTFQQVFNYGNIVGWMAITAHDDVPITDVKERVFDFLKQRHRIHPEDDRAIGHFDLYAEFKKLNGLFVILKVIAFFVGGLVLLSGVIGISNIMLIVVKERTKEIGVRRALGATPWSIRTQILLESIVLTLFAGMVGIIFSTLILYGVNTLLEQGGNDMMFKNPIIDPLTVMVSLGILVFFGLLAGFIPAQSAINVKPIDALRAE